jgi:hypothetical protein
VGNGAVDVATKPRNPKVHTFRVLMDSFTFRADGDSVAISRIFALPAKLPHPQQPPTNPTTGEPNDPAGGGRWEGAREPRTCPSTAESAWILEKEHAQCQPLTWPER